MIVFHSHADHEFIDTPYPGVRTCAVWSDGDEGAYFPQFKAGARFPLHDHQGPEINYLISGNVRFGDMNMLPGDFAKLSSGDQHAAHAQSDSLLYTVYRGALLIQE